MSEDADRPVRNSELKSELKSMRLEFRLWIAIAIIAQGFLPTEQPAQAALRIIGLG